MEQEEALLVRRAAAGEEDAFEQLVVRYQKNIYNLTLRMSGNPEDAYDLAQEAFLRAWRSLSSFQFEASFSTWLYRLATNLCIDFLRRQRRGKTIPLQFEEDDEKQELPLPDPKPGPEEQAMLSEDRQAVADALSTLEPVYRMALTMRVIDGLSYQEIAAALEVREGTVKSRIARAREKMRQILLQRGNFSGADSSNPAERGEDA
jgi:RNA polymerase sigma factor (sigma-70 family)